MGEGLRRRIKQEKFSSPQQEALLNVVVAANYLREETERILAGLGVTLPQYNVLRILRGIYPEGHPRCEISTRMLDRAPDVTRIVDRLEEKGLAERDRSGSDRRQSITRITREGLKLLETIDGPMRELFDGLSGRLSTKECRELSRLCESIYGE